MVEQLPHCDLLKLILLTERFVLSARQVLPPVNIWICDQARTDFHISKPIQSTAGCLSASVGWVGFFFVKILQVQKGCTWETRSLAHAVPCLKHKRVYLGNAFPGTRRAMSQAQKGVPGKRVPWHTPNNVSSTKGCTWETRSLRHATIGQSEFTGHIP